MFPGSWAVRRLPLLMVLFLLFAGCAQGQENAAAMTRATLTLQWYPQTQFAGYYMALEKGFYAARGIDLEIRRGGSDVDAIGDLRSGRTDFATLFLTAGIRYRSKDLPLVNVGQIVNRGNLLIVAYKNRGISSVRDLNGRKMSLWGDHFSGGYKKLFSDNGIWPVIIPQFISVEVFLRGGVDACSAMSYNEYIRILHAGRRPEDLVVISLRDEGYDFPEDGIYCTEETWRRNPRLARDLREASLEGWRYAAEHPDEAVELILRKADEAGYIVNRLLLRRMLDTILPSILPEDAPGWTPGVLSKADYERTFDMMETVFVEMTERVPYDVFFPGAGGR
ncbi:NitT/TauT family transport system substrate-binding protein [Aminivibrio pyruvatiphilus]|jgi:NitT/TauT family transport system substrate-binding protein|uniref:Thiamine pyrimidine synthase n=1 Tax=Aminivibrio pyruvatiphilus TaxID=1005740 RepID=A0A4R8M4K7_9BACT|nr:ABC transporter substrate-binding protein [Aminivibrio pyruvatiphilus]TDY60179.1 NitT/TauT family transport system substrate-binding protein [Aminivibrio pyruvatiphilus]